MSEGFDLKVHHRDPESGKVVKTTPYSLRITKDEGATYTRGGIEYHPDGSVKRDPYAERAAEKAKLALEEKSKAEALADKAKEHSEQEKEVPEVKSRGNKKG